MPLESVEISRVNAEGDNINLTAADVDSFDVASIEVEILINKNIQTYDFIIEKPFNVKFNYPKTH